MYSKVSMLPVGQGAMNLIEIYDENVLVNLTLIDCGSIDGQDVSKQACEVSIAYASEKMKKRWENSQIIGSPAFLDNLIITHKDGDHWNKLNSLIESATEMPIDRISNNLGYYQQTDSEEKLDEYFFNRQKGYCKYQTSYISDCEITMSLTWTQSGQDETWMIEVEYSYEDMDIVILWKTDRVGIKVFNAAMIDPVYYIHIQENTLYINWQKAGDCSVPQDCEEFNRIFEEIYNNYLKNLIYIDQTLFSNMLGTMELSSVDIMNVFKQVPAEVPPIIGNVYIGGNNNSKGVRFSRMMNTLTQISMNIWSQMPENNEIGLWGNYKLCIIKRLYVNQLENICNVKLESSIKNNATSIVSVLLLNGDTNFQRIVFSGDATVHTFYEMLLDIQNNRTPAALYNNAVWTAPHHGAWNTICQTISDDAQTAEIFLALLNEVKPKEMVISAGFQSQYGHPCNSFVGLMKEQLENYRGDDHWIYYNSDNNRKPSDRGNEGWITEQVSIPLYTLWNGNNYENRYFEFSLEEPSVEGSLYPGNQNPLETHSRPMIGRSGKEKTFLTTGLPPKNMFFHRGRKMQK